MHSFSLVVLVVVALADGGPAPEPRTQAPATAQEAKAPAPLPEPRWTGLPGWLGFATVKTGLLAERITPLDGAYIAGDGVIVLPYDEQVIKHAPKAPRDHVLTPSMASEVADHFDLG